MSEATLTARQRAMVAALSVTGNITRAARDAQVSRRAHYAWMQKSEDYVEAVEGAMVTAKELYEEEARRRAIEGVRKYKFHRGDPVMVPCEQDHPEAVAVEGPDGDIAYRRHYYELEYSDILLIFTLKALDPEKYRERYDVNQRVSLHEHREVTVRFVDEDSSADLPVEIKRRMPGGNGASGGNGHGGK